MRHQIPIRGSVWEENQAGWLEVDTVALCGGSVAGEFVWMLDGVDYATTWVEMRAPLGAGPGGNAGRAARYRILPASYAAGIGQRQRRGVLELPRDEVAATAAATGVHDAQLPYKKDDNAHVEQKNWTHIRQYFGYERHDNPEVVEPINVLVKGAYGQLLNYFHASLKLERKERTEGKLKRIYGAAQTPLARVLASPEVTPQTKLRLQQEKARLNPFALKRQVERSLKTIAALRRVRP